MFDLVSVKQHIQQLQLHHKKIVFTNGCFDIIHVGHVTYLQQARALGDVLIVGINSDRSPFFKKKGIGRPFICERDRLRILSEFRCVDYVVKFDENDPLSLICYLQPDILVKGGDYNIDDIVGAKEVLNSGGQVKTLPFVPGKSTTDLVRKIQNEINSFA